MERLPRERRVDAGVRERNRLRRPFERLCRGNLLPQLFEHGPSGLDRDDLITKRDEAARELPRSGAHVEDARALRESKLLRCPAKRPFRILRPVPLVLGSHGLEATGACGAVRHGSKGRGR